MKRTWTTVAGLACAVSLAISGVGPAAAQDSSTTLTVTESVQNNVWDDGESLTVSGSGFAAVADIALTLTDLDGNLIATFATATTDSFGEFSASIERPAALTDGQYRLVAVGTGADTGDLTLSATVTVDSSVTGPTTTTTEATTTTTEADTTTTAGDTTTTTEADTTTTEADTTTTTADNLGSSTTVAATSTSTTSAWNTTTTYRRTTTTATSGDNLPVTGSTTAPLAVGAAVLLGAGGHTLYYRRRALLGD